MVKIAISLDLRKIYCTFTFVSDILDSSISNGWFDKATSKSSIQKILKWAPRSRQGVFVGFSKLHSSLTGLILNCTTGSITAQFYLVFVDSFATVHSDKETVPDTHGSSDAFFACILLELALAITDLGLALLLVVGTAGFPPQSASLVLDMVVLFLWCQL